MKNPAGIPNPFSSLSFALLGLGAAMLAAGCGGSPKLARDLMSEEVNTGATAEHPVAMRGEAAFAQGKLGLVAVVYRGFERQAGESHAKGNGHEIRAHKHREDDIDEDISYGS